MSAPHSRFGARLDVMSGIAPAQETPGTNFMSATAAGVFPVHSARLVAPYLLAGASVSLSKYLDPAFSPVAGTGVRLQLGALRPYVEARVQQRAGLSMLFGLAF
jgi:hypothetical protein